MRTVIVPAGAFLLAAGAGTLLLGLGPTADVPLLAPAVARFAAAHQLFWPVVAAVLETALVAAAMTLPAQWRAVRYRRRSGLDGPARERARAAAGDLRREALELEDVRDVRVGLTGPAARPRLLLTVTCPPDAPLAEVCAALGAGPVHRYRAAAGLDGLVADVRFDVLPGAAAQSDKLR
ncbi:hypothetical protein [Actinomadura macrotermitis]|uniref:Alkaline shock response membrane anchor protein AmaP n=1 Tax=Actinomadura macrotermitis TaxID=2585200 RepID=A0A7K0BZU6_9ACTN|nr:hypothetical protein [Actinomadura macrotermitis]MQY06713.1 hypothetical protein [Actinomadura macrotermitis]